MNRDILSEKIEAWLSGELPPEEAQAFVAEIARDKALADEVEVHRLEREAIAEMVRRDLEADLSRWDENPDEWPAPPAGPHPGSPPPSGTNALRHYRWSVLLLLLPLAVAFWFFWPEKPSPVPPIPPQENQQSAPPSSEPANPQAPTTPSEKKKPVAEAPPPAKKKNNEVAPAPTPEYAASLNNLGKLYQDKGDFEKAEPLYLEALAIQEKALGKAHPEYVASLNNLADLYRNKGDLEKAEPLYLEVSAAQTKALGKENREAVIPEDLRTVVSADMSAMQGDILAALSPTKGAGDPQDVSEQRFAAASEFFKTGKPIDAKKELLQITPGTRKYADAQQMLAKIYYDEKNYRLAALCYEKFAEEDSNPETKWRRVQLYLADYPYQKANFWKRLNELIEKGTASNKARATRLRDELRQRGISER